MSISGIVPILPLQPVNQTDETKDIALGNAVAPNGSFVQKAGSDFARFLNDALKQVDSLQKDADVATAGLVTGQVQDLHTVMIALQKANLAMSLTVEVRNKVLDAYSTMMHMQL